MAGEVFIDWLTCAQHHPCGGLPIILNGVDVRYDRSGVARHEHTFPTSVAGSFESAIRVGCDGSRVFLSGNVGRFGREDNLFNHRWAGTVASANRILAGLGLPAFSSAAGISERGAPLGARVSRLDLTCNFCTGSPGQARAVIRWLAAQSIARIKRGQVGNESVWWANTRYMLKAYCKGPEMENHGKSPDEFLVDWCNRHGVVRVEVELKRRLLAELGLVNFADISDERLAAIYTEQTSILRRVDRSDEPDILAAIPSRSRAYAAAWLAGQDMQLLASRATLFRHARCLREYGIDILTPRNVETFPIRVRVVDLVPAAVPDWYQLKVA